MFSPSGPRGPRESLIGSRRVAGAATFFDGLGPLLAGDLGVEGAERVASCSFDFASVTNNR